MKLLRIYASLTDPNNVYAVLNEAFKDKRADITVTEGGAAVTVKKSFGKETVRVAVLTAADKPEALNQKIDALKSDLRLPEEAEPAAKLVLTQLAFVNTVIEFESAQPFGEETLAALFTFNTRLPGLALTEDGGLLNHKNEPLRNAAGQWLGAAVHVFAAEHLTGIPKAAESAEGRARKQRSLDRLKAMGIPVLESLPPLSESAAVKPRTKDEICERAAALLLLIQYACDVAQGGDLKQSKETVAAVLERYEVLDCLTPVEQQFFYTDNPDLRQAMSLTWQYEACWALLWALGYVQELSDPTATCDAEAALRTVLSHACYDDFYDEAKVRPVAELLDEADFIYRLNWACVEARIKKIPLAAPIDFGVTAERHRALNWLIRYKNAEWDDVTMDT